MYGTIEIKGARENNLKDVSLEIPKGKITVFTGVSGSGKSSLVFGTIAAESQRLINETFSAFAQQFLPRHSQPDADLLANLSAAIVVDQARMGGNSRSTVGTATDASTMLRVIYARMGEPNLGYPSAFSFNNPQGMCLVCEGIGNVSAVDLDVLLDWNKSLNEGAILFPGFEVGEWWHRSLVQSGFYDSDKLLKEFTKEELDKLLYLSDGSKVKIDFGSGTMNSTYEGVIARLNRSYLNKETDKLKGKVKEFVERIATRGSCTACGGTRLNETARSSYVEGKNIADCAAMQVSDLAAFVRSLQEPSLQPMIDALAARLDSLVHIGLGYLSLDRESSTLSGGESQRVKMVRHLGSSLTDVTYIFDEPSVGLHPHDVHRMNELLVQLRDKGNTVLVVEHEPEVIALADHVVDMGPGAGRKGGEVVY
ncbi:excinuclease ABC subunit UvrA, partial [bacterium]